MTGDPSADAASDARLAADVLGGVPAPRPEVLARVLAGLRDLPDVPAVPAAPRTDLAAPEHSEAVPLPRRRL